MTRRPRVATELEAGCSAVRVRDGIPFPSCGEHWAACGELVLLEVGEAVPRKSLACAVTAQLLGVTSLRGVGHAFTGRQ